MSAAQQNTVIVSYDKVKHFALPLTGQSLQLGKETPKSTSMITWLSERGSHFAHRESHEMTLRM